MPSRLSELTSPKAVEEAIAECDQLGRDAFLKKYGFRYSRVYPLHFNDEIYDSKAIAAVAYGKQFGTALKAKEFSGGAATVVPVLRRLGFPIFETPHPATTLEIGAVYSRKHLLDTYGGQLQRGIWTPKEFPVVFLFTGKSGEHFGYRDGLTESGVFKYTGEGQLGHMTFTPGNTAIRDHRRAGKDLLLFEDLGKGKGVRFTGLYECAAWDLVDGTDKSGHSRKLIVFDLVPVSTSASSSLGADAPSVPPTKPITLLRKAAFEAANSMGQPSKSSNTRRIWYERSEAVRDYVLSRANGICEACGAQAPFTRKDGSPYLEPHHTTRLADEGLDHPAHVGAICPNCHRRIHSGTDGADWNKALQAYLIEKEALESQ